MAYTNKGPGDSDTWGGYYGHPNDPRRPPDPEDFDDDQDAPVYESDKPSIFEVKFNDTTIKPKYKMGGKL